MNTTSDIQICEICHEPYYISRKQLHYNLHKKPINLKPYTKPNQLKKIFQSKINIQDTTNCSDISLRSILPEEIPKPQFQKRIIEAPSHVSYTISGQIKNINNNKQNVIRDYMQLQSNVANTQIRQQQIEKLFIQKPIQIKATKKLISKKQLPNYQNTKSQHLHILSQNQQLRAPKKVYGTNGAANVQDEKQPIVNNSSPNTNTLIQPQFKAQPVYEAKTIKQPQRSNKTRVQIGKRITPAPQQFKTIQTKSNIKEISQNRIKSIKDQISDMEGDNMTSNSRILGSPQNKIPLHQNQCPSCHGFYCQYCKATIPPNYRPFWDQNESPELIQFYKKRINDEIQRRRKQQMQQCIKCEQH